MVVDLEMIAQSIGCMGDRAVDQTLLRTDRR